MVAAGGCYELWKGWIATVIGFGDVKLQLFGLSILLMAEILHQFIGSFSHYL